MAETMDAIFTLFAAACGVLVLYGGWIALRHGSADGDALRKNNSSTDSPNSASPRRNDRLGALLILAAIAVAMPHRQLHADSPFDEAMRDYERGKYGSAHVKLRAVAESGDPQAQEILGLMYAFGSQLYPGIPQDLRAAGLWLDRAARAGRPAARIAYCAITRKEYPGRTQRIACIDWVAQSGQPAKFEAVSRFREGRNSLVNR